MVLIPFSLCFMMFLMINTARSVDNRCSQVTRDIIILLDSSDVISHDDFSNAKKAIELFLSYFLVSATDTRVSLVGYGESAKVDFKFTKYLNSANLNFGIRLHRRIRGGSSIGLGLNLTLTDVVPEMRTDVNRVLILISDGQNTGSLPAQFIASQIKAENVDIYAIGIGPNINLPELQSISSNKQVTTYTNVDAMIVGIGNMINSICIVRSWTTTGNNLVETAAPIETIDVLTEQTCPRQDIIFVLDGSSSMLKYWNDQVNFVSNVVANLQTGDRSSQIGLIIFSDISQTNITLGSILNIKELINKIKNLSFLDGSTYTTNMLNSCLEEFANHGRSDTKKTIIIISDGVDNSPDNKSSVAASILKTKGVIITVIGFGNNIDKNFLNTISSNGNSEIFDSNQDLMNYAKSLVKILMC